MDENVLFPSLRNLVVTRYTANFSVMKRENFLLSTVYPILLSTTIFTLGCWGYSQVILHRHSPLYGPVEPHITISDRKSVVTSARRRGWSLPQKSLI